MKILVPFSQDQKEHVIDHLAYGSELGILESEYIWIHKCVKAKMLERNISKFKISNAHLNLEEGVWEVSCECGECNEKETKAAKVEYNNFRRSETTE